MRLIEENLDMFVSIKTKNCLFTDIEPGIEFLEYLKKRQIRKILLLSAINPGN